MSARQIVDECVVLRVRRLSRTLTRRQDMALRPLGITSPQLILLAYLSANQGTQAVDLCKALNIEKSTMTRNLMRLLALGHISMGPPGGRRGRTLSITESGEDAVAEAFPIWDATQQKLLELMSREERDALSLLA